MDDDESVQVDRVQDQAGERADRFAQLPPRVLPTASEQDVAPMPGSVDLAPDVEAQFFLRWAPGA